MEKVRVIGDGYCATFSRGLFANALTRAGIGPELAYDIADAIKAELIKEGKFEITSDELIKIAHQRLKGIDGKFAKRFLLWNQIRRHRKPMVVLIGGASGVGTTTIAAEVAHRMGIRNVIGTDMIREVMRKIISKDLSPSLHESSFTAWQVLRVPPPMGFDESIAGFLEHCKQVAVGIEAVIDRALQEGINVVIEGTHIVPGVIRKEYLRFSNVGVFILYIGDEESHMGRFRARSRDTQLRALERYIKSFDTIRKLHDYIVEQARANNIEPIEDAEIDETVNLIMEEMTTKILEE